MKNNRYLFLVTLIYFAVGLINIHFALLGLFCMGIPVYLLLRDRKKTWCQGYCPRASLYTVVGKKKPYKNLSTPKYFIKGSMKWIMLGYFCVNLTIIILSTIMVSIEKIPPMDYLRFLFVLPLPQIPQLFFIQSAGWLLHLSYRFYSIMMTTTILGFILAIIYKPRTWCAICPIATISDEYIKSVKNKS